MRIFLLSISGASLTGFDTCNESNTISLTQIWLPRVNSTHLILTSTLESGLCVKSLLSPWRETDASRGHCLSLNPYMSWVEQSFRLLLSRKGI